LNEFQLDQNALRRILAAGELTGKKRLEALLATVRDFPDYTPASMLLLIEMRKQGHLKSLVTDRLEKVESTIPKHVIQFWDTEKAPDDIAALNETWRVNNPEMTYTRFSDARARDFLKAIDNPAILKAYVQAREPAMKADIFRLAYLYHQGGYYADADDRSLAPIAKIDPGGCNLLLYQEDIGSLGNNFIGAVPRQPIIGRALADATDAINRGDTDMLWLATGPGLLSRTFTNVLAKAGQNWHSVAAEAVVLERHELLEMLAMHCVTSYKHTSRHWSRTAFGNRKQVVNSSDESSTGAECASFLPEPS
jgi:mannosyltransferase OCH1-like enzyme